MIVGIQLCRLGIYIQKNPFRFDLKSFNHAGWNITKTKFKNNNYYGDLKLGFGYEFNANTFIINHE